MAQSWISDFEKLFAKCAVDADYRAQLSSALANDNDEQVWVLLGEIDAAGAEGGRSARIKALKDALPAMVDVSGRFGQPQPLVAP